MALSNWASESFNQDKKRMNDSFISSSKKIKVNLYKDWLYYYIDDKLIGEIHEGHIFIGSVEVFVKRTENDLVFSYIRDLEVREKLEMLGIQRYAYIGKYDDFIDITEDEIEQLYAWKETLR